MQRLNRLSMVVIAACFLLQTPISAMAQDALNVAPGVKPAKQGAVTKGMEQPAISKTVNPAIKKIWGGR